jgi:prepilin-type N-terminal cleavage/methylation domain-containing protein
MGKSFARRAQKLRGFENAFTLIEMSIVLVIIGLIVGGVLVGQNLISASGVRATITQIEKYNTATNTFRGKYGYLPGDIKDPDASMFGFAARGQYAGEGDGNGVLEGTNLPASPNTNYGTFETTGETAMFWVDLSTSHLIDGGFSFAQSAVLPSSSALTVDKLLPTAKMGQGNYIYVYSGGPQITHAANGGNNLNYFGLSAVGGITQTGPLNSSPGLSVRQAFDIDKKVDDGLPQSGRVTSLYVDYNSLWQLPQWAGAGGVTGAPYTTATPGSATSCFDNGSVAGNVQQYSLTQSNGNGVNCALSFQFQ